tara:strand:+ start:142 stop:363 length:222 start_codon:yes stop_codon:yes gene_type:complete
MSNTKTKNVLKYELPGLYMTVGWKEGKGFCVYYKNTKREGMAWYETSKETMQEVNELYESHQKIPAMIRKGFV